MWIMAGRAPQSPGARAETFANLHLLDVPHGFDSILLGPAVHRVKRDQGESGTIVEFIMAEPGDPLVAQEVTLLGALVM